VTVDGQADLRPWFAEVEAMLTRFDPGSPLSWLNAHPERWVVVPQLLLHAVGAALEAAAATDGAFDPTILGALEGAGYGQSFDLGPTPGATAAPARAGRWGEVRLDRHLQAIWLPQGVRLDLVNAGGDLACRTAPRDMPYLIDIEDPFDSERTIATFGLHRGAAATSSVMGRRWGEGLHHIIDPRTGRPARSNLVQATVFGPRAAMAEVLAKAAIVLGEHDGLRLVQKHGHHALIVRSDGSIIMTEGLEEYRHGAA
ncbi:MAG: ApbE family lipoprotein, partial [Symbiobacteriaceae bacterium]|nr:ApbE family lipoprotein [Symbiobacteriaceae bacterium]